MSALPLLVGAAVGALVVAALPSVISSEVDSSSPGSAVVAAGTASSGDPQSARASLEPAPTLSSAGAGRVPTDSGVDVGPSAAQAGRTAAANSLPLRVGILLFDVGAVSRVGVAVPNFSPEEQRAVYEVFVEDLNKRGGVQGRKIEPVYKTYNILDFDDMRAACVSLTEDAKVSIVLDPVGAFYGPPVVCVTEEHGTPFLSSGSTAFTDEMFNRSRGRLFTILQRGSRILANEAHLLQETGVLTPTAVIGVVDDSRSGDAETVHAGLIRTLEKLGYRVAVRATLAPDNATSASQMPIFVQRMKAAGVDHVFLAVGTLNATQFVQAADKQLFDPEWFSSDWFAGAGDNWAQNMPASFDGSVAVTASRTGEWRVDRPEPARDAACRAVYESGSDARPGRGDTAYGLMTGACNIFGLLAAGGNASRQSLTADALSAGVRSLGRIDLANVAAASFGPAKFDAADHVRALRWEAACKCWKPASDFRSAKY